MSDLTAGPDRAQGWRENYPCTVLGVETSCDDTCAAVVHLSARGDPRVIGERVARQNAAHAPYGGVVPEIAARAHAELLDDAIASAMATADVTYGELDGVAATAGPGLIGGVMVGAMTAKAIALAHDLPFVAVNHLEGHALSPFLSETVTFPYLLLLVSGGHTQLLVVDDVGRYRRLGSTIDDAAGEAFDKTAKILGLGHPGGPELEKLAAAGDPDRFALPRPLAGAPGCDFSFAGLKTAAARLWAGLEAPSQADRADLAAAFQQAAADVLADRARHALDEVAGEVTALVVAGGVAANQTVRVALAETAQTAGLALIAPPLKWCTDNAAMIAYAGAQRLRRGWTSPLDVPARPRWPLDEEAAAAAPASGSGRKGPKA